MNNISPLTSARSWLTSIVFLLAAQYAPAQQTLSQAEIEAQLQQRSTIERELGPKRPQMRQNCSAPSTTRVKMQCSVSSYFNQELNKPTV
jgi:hypothetical protein